MALIVETSAGQVFQVEEFADPTLSHCYGGYEVKQTKRGYVRKAGATSRVVRKAGCHVLVLDTEEEAA